MRVLLNGEPVAGQVEVADSKLAQAKGLMFRRSIPDEYALVFPFDDVEQRSVHMLFVPFPITVVWVVNGQVEAVKRLAPWIGIARARADTLLELPEAAIDGIDVGDEVRIEEA